MSKRKIKKSWREKRNRGKKGDSWRNGVNKEMKGHTEGRHIVDERVVVLGTDETCGEDDGVEGDIVLRHKIEEADLGRILPPTCPLGRVVCSNREVPDGRVEPHIEYLLNQ